MQIVFLSPHPSSAAAEWVFSLLERSFFHKHDINYVIGISLSESTKTLLMSFLTFEHEHHRSKMGIMG